jgi:AraC-like DNA-binding protein
LTYPPDFTLRLNGVPAIHHCEPWWRWSPPPLPDYDLWCILEGEGVIRLSEKTYELRTGICFILTPGEAPIATQNPHQRLKVFYVHFDPLDRHGSVIPPREMSLPPQGIVVKDTGFFEGQARSCAAYAEHGGEALARRQMVLTVEQLLLHLWEEASRPAMNPLDQRLREIGAEIRGNPGGDWSVEVQAERACLSRSQYTRRFVHLYGIAPNRFVIRCRLERAAQLLAETDMTVGETAEALGYRDLFFFSRQFKTHFGVPPGTLRRTGR